MSWAHIYLKAAHATILLILCIGLIHGHEYYNESYERNAHFFPKVDSMSDHFGFPLLHNIGQGVKIFRNGTEEEAVMKLSPTRVIRAITAQAFEWKAHCVIIITETKFDIIARLWQQFLLGKEHILLAILIVLRNNYFAENLQCSDQRKSCYNTITIVLLTSDKIDILFKNQTFEYLNSNGLSIDNNRFIVIGTCPPCFIRKYSIYENLRMVILRVDTEKWLNGNLPIANATLHSINRNAEAVWSTYPFKTIMKDNLLKTSTSHPNKIHYGTLNNIIINSFAYVLPDTLQKKNDKIVWFLGEVIVNLQDYLDFRMIIMYHNVSHTKEYRILARTTIDLHIGTFFAAHRLRRKFLPPLHRDGITIFAAKLESSMKIEALFSIFKLKVWIVLLAVICGVNMCYFLTLMASPSLKNNQRLQTKSNASLLRIACFDSLIASPMEWQMARHLPSRWFLVSLNFLFFFASTVYLILFSVRVLADKRSFPFQSINETCMPTLFHVAKSKDGITLMNGEVCGDDRFGCTLLKHYQFTSDDQNRVANGTWIVIMSKLLGEEYFKHHPYVSHYEVPLCERYSTIETASDFLFFDIFEKLILRLREVGSLHVAYTRNIPMAKREYSIIRKMTFSETWFSFAICGIGIFIAVTALCVEKLVESQANKPI